MNSQEILTEIRSLKSDLGAYADHMVRVRYDDLKAAFLQQMRMAVSEEGQRTFQTEALDIKDSSACPHKAECMRKLEKAVESAAVRFKKDDFAEAVKILDDVEDLIEGSCTPCRDGECSHRAAETLRRVRTVLQVYESLAGKLEIERAPIQTQEPAAEAKPEDVEALLDPLANAWRIKALETLMTGDRSLSELGKALDLRTGHLQFHLKALVEASYVSLDRRRHRYHITDRGVAALGCVRDMVAKVGPPHLSKTRGYAGEGVPTHAV